VDVGEMQRKLSCWAEENSDHRFFDLYHLLYDKNWLRLAHDYVAQNAGSKTAGCDGINMREFDAEMERNLNQLAQELKAESFEPFPVRRAYIPKANGKLRPLGIPSVKDRIVQEAIRMVLEPIYEADFSQYSFGFRPNRRTMDAIRYIYLCTIGKQRYYWTIEGDISSCFEAIHHRRLIELLRERIADRKLLHLIWQYLRAGVMEGNLFRDTTRGTPQGGIVSPLLANVYLHELDRYMERYTALSTHQKRKRRWRREANFLYSRYADDFVVLCNGTKAEAEKMKEELARFLSGHLYLKLSTEKTKITHLNDGFTFLGFWLERHAGGDGKKTRVLIPSAAVDRVREKIRKVTDAATCEDSVNAKIISLNRIVGGWCRYYQYTSRASTQFYGIAGYLYWRMAHWLGRKFSLSMPEVIERYRKDKSFGTTEYRLRLPTEFPTRRYTDAVKKPNPYTMQKVELKREELPNESFWTGYERRPGMADLRPLVLERDEYTCQLCDKKIKVEDAQVDHIEPFRKFKRPVDANRLENLWTLCIACHQWKTEFDRQMESRMR
jgi:RNA-directed DNA polymerase